MATKELVHPGSQTQQTVKAERVWTPRLVFWTTVFLGLPAGAALAAANWVKIGLARKAFIAIAVAWIVTLVGLLLTPMLFGGFSGQVMGLLFIILWGGGATCFHLEMRKDVSNFKRKHSVKDAHCLAAVSSARVACSSGSLL